MKKIALTSLLAVFAVSAASAANVINGDPLYRPAQGHFYSVSTLASHSESTDTWGVQEEFGYGITKEFAVYGVTNAGEADWFDGSEWGDFKLGANFRALDLTNWKLDVYGEYNVSPVWGDHDAFLEKDTTEYTWTAGVRGGYTTGIWTVAGHVAFDYYNTESFNWGDDGIHLLRVGVDGLYSIDRNWSLLAGAEYTGVLDDKIGGWDVKNAGEWDLNVGVNYNIDATKFVGLYAGWTLNHQDGDNADEWGFEDGFEFGAKFGIDF